MGKGTKGRRGTVFAVLSGLLLVSAATTAGSNKLTTFETKAQVTLDAQGVPTAVAVPKELPEPIAHFIEQQVMSWRFQPPQVEGQPRGGTTWLALGACAAPVDSGFQLAIDYKGSGPATTRVDGSYQPPPYPPAAARQGFELTSTVTFIVEPDGRATLESLTYNRYGRNEQRLFEPVLRAWVQSLRFDPETVEGTTVRTRVSIPVDFMMGNDGPPRERPSQKPECKTAMKKGDDKRAVALDSPFKRIEGGG